MKVTGAETKVQKPKTKKGKRALQQREPKLVSCCFSGSFTKCPIITNGADFPGELAKMGTNAGGRCKTCVDFVWWQDQSNYKGCAF